MPLSFVFASPLKLAWKPLFRKRRLFLTGRMKHLYYGKQAVRHADGVFDSRFDRYVTVREDCRESSLNPSTTIVAIDLSDNNIQEPKVLVGGSDFYAFPRVDSKGEQIARIEWSHPNMLWDKAKFWVGYISENGNICKRICAAGCVPTLLEQWGFEGASAVHPLSSAKVTLDDHKSEAVDFKIIWSSSADISECESHFSLLELIELPTEVPSQNAYAYFIHHPTPFIKPVKMKSLHCHWKAMEESKIHDAAKRRPGMRDNGC
ncbi:hypothetical protein CK203_014620 [Vitis vinifera]|uniref:Uncharacterized protein n=1 Tax=Vitis vinifera TaxID=29760 RepID=A0A438JGD7_VITVI|nr:hypothetical protein CK203_014620 [Vitis vinifera]